MHISLLCVSVCVCVFCFAISSVLPFPCLMATSCVLCFALSLHIYIKHRSTAGVSLHLCCTCHLSLPASLIISSLSGPPQFFSQLSHLIIFPFSYEFGQLNLSFVFVRACMCPLSFLMPLRLLSRNPLWILLSLLRSDNPETSWQQLALTFHFAENSCL